MGRGETGRTILVIDGDADVADSVAMLLGYRGYRVEVARSGDAGLAVAIATRPDAILLDLALPGLDGYAVAARLRARGDFDGVPIIAVTGYGMESDRRRSREAGIDHHVLKPCDSVDLLNFLGDPAAAAVPRAVQGSGSS
jgi:CheY-like chemotaxis protein